MADSDKNILITPNRGQSTEPKIEFVGSSSLPITLKVLDDNSLSWEGSEGQLFSITNNLSSGSIFSVNDISGVPSIEVNADGTVILAEFSGNVGVGTASPTKKFEVSGSDIVVNEIVIGKGPGNQSSNTILGVNVLNSNTTGNYNVAIGSNALYENQSGSSNVAVGYRSQWNNVGNNYNTSLGDNTLQALNGQYANYNTAVGYRAGYLLATGYGNTFIGDGAGDNVTTGVYNTLIGGYGGTSTLSQTVVLSDGVGNTRLWINSSGKVGIGIESPGELLDVRSSTATVGQGARIGEAKIGTWEGNTDWAAFTHNSLHGTQNSYSIMQNVSGRTLLNSAAGQNLEFRIGNSTKMTLLSGGNFGINTTNPTDNLQVNGGITCTTLTETSSRTLKSNIQTLPSQLEKIKKLNPVSYTRKETNKEEVGLIAEEVNEIYPEFATNEKINYSKMVAVLFSAVQELTAKVEKQQEEIKKLKTL